MISKINNAQPQDAFDGRVQIEASTSYGEVKANNLTPIRQASIIEELEEELSAISLADDQELVEKLEEMVEDWGADGARAEAQAPQEKNGSEKLQAAMKCGLCLEMVRSPQTLDCGHSACHKCLRSWWTRPIDGSEDPIVSTDDEDYEHEIVPRPRRRFYSAVERTKVCPTCKKVITRRPVPSLMLSSIVQALHGLDPIPPRVEVQGDERAPPKDIWRGIFPEEPERPPTDPEEVNRQRHQEVLQIRLELEESLERHHQDLQVTVARINRLQVLISEERDEAVERWRSWVAEF